METSQNYGVNAFIVLFDIMLGPFVGVCQNAILLAGAFDGMVNKMLYIIKITYSKNYVLQIIKRLRLLQMIDKRFQFVLHL